MVKTTATTTTLNDKSSFLITLNENLMQFIRGVVCGGSGGKVLQTKTAIDRVSLAHSPPLP